MAGGVCWYVEAGGNFWYVVAGGISAGVLWLVESAGVLWLVVRVAGGGPRKDTLGVWVDCFSLVVEAMQHDACRTK